MGGQLKLRLPNSKMFRRICTLPSRSVISNVTANTLQQQRKFIQSGVFQCRFSFQVHSRSWNHTFLTHAEVAKRFEEFDMDEDGLITVAECRAALDRLDRELSDGFVRESIWKWDYNKDGVVDYFEFINYFLRDHAADHAGCDHDSHMEFNSIDELLQHCTNKDSFLDKDELQVAMKSMNPDLSAGQINIMIGDIVNKGDRNGDSLIDLYEFSSFAVQQGLYS